MNSFDDQLERLFRTAAKAPLPQVASPAFGLETQALAAWREGQSSGAGFWDMTLLVRGLILASLIMAISLWPAFKSSEGTTNPFSEYLQLADSTVPSDDAP